MKKYYFIMLLCMVVWPLSAQTPNEDTKQKTVTVRTGAYKPAKLDTILAEQPKPEPIKEPEPPKIKKEPSNKPWYNVFSISIVGGPIITKNSLEPLSPVSHLMMIQGVMVVKKGVFPSVINV